MTVARIFTPENRLAKILEAIQAPTAAELIADAESRVEALGDAIRTYVAEKLEEIRAFAEQSEDVLFAECRTLGETAMNVAEVAGAAGLEAVGEVARGISAMVDNLISSGVWHTDALRLHLDALALVNASGGGMTPENEVILMRLRGMREAVGVVE
ncbi:cheE protein [Phenylobacterium zucineum HLK1]|uniref:CheE protein n=1 Tax=Phenylobacterium zucineum (strain HLK1) TaxID=450851 RepID=B4RAP1_PHEZH|nr:hypothetical protein [Phenylobacterium zucineum]ACG79639.1 cheE protein [Phenylobacterium zucineum HLK1]